ncbi:MAG: hypothetical protein QOI21_1992 [Actinomycetota bacterium]|jgi:hypothetical protein|nr:hypothetical protein [Actinomycetota bacterium]
MPENKAIDLFARIGLFCYGIVHLVVAWLAVQIGLGEGAKADKKGALQIIAAEGGAWLLWLVAAGLGVLLVWQLTEAITGHKNVEPQRRVVRRVISGIEVLLYGMLAYSAGKIAVSGSSEGSQSSIVATILAQPYGRVLIIAAGVAVVGIAGFLAYRGIAKNFVRELDFGRTSRPLRTATIRLGQIGWPALGAAYATVGVMLVVSAVDFDPAKASGLDVALKNLASQPYGQILLLVLAAGIAAFGVFALLDARFRKL